ncbi:MAG: response regulator, partial [Clostridiales bacterium]|nr:response regulator [Clostridiales bacterium]
CGICSVFAGADETDVMITKALKMIGEFLELSRVMLLDYQQPALHCQYEWYDQSRKGSSKLDSLMLLEDKEALLAQDFERHGMDWYAVYDNDPEDIIARYNLDAFACLFVPVFCKESFWGLLRFDQCGEHAPWTETDISLGKIVADILSLVLNRCSLEDNLLASLNEAKQTAEQASRAKGDFLSRMSHEMRTPLNAIIGMTDIALSSKEVGKKDYCLNQIDNASKHLLNVINDILDMSKMEASQLTLSKDEFDFEQALMDIIDVVRFRAEEKQQDLVINMDSNVPRSLIGDEVRIGQVITNLLTNAIKFTPDGGVIKLNVSQIAAEGDLLTLMVEVIDNGIGISEAQQARLFTSFEQGDGGIARKYGGTGLGLSICKHIVNLMGGDIRVQSVIDQGSTFSFTMKLQKGKRQMEHDLTINISRGEIRILAVDDQKDILEYFRQIMSALGLPCDTAASGAEALKMIEDRFDDPYTEPYNIFFVDWQMPEMDGIELTKKIRALTGYSTVIIMISGSPWCDMEREAVAAGVSHFIPKPLFPSNLINGINECVGVAAKDRAAAKKAVMEGGYNFKNLNLLLAEDVPANREIIHILLADTHIGIDNAINGRQALEMFTQNPKKYSLILMDINMPEMNGNEASRAIRELPCEEGQNIPIIAMTADVLGEDAAKCPNDDVNGQISKPVEIKQLLDILATHLHTPGASHPSAGKKDDSYKPISYSRGKKNAPEENYAGFLPLLDVQDGLNRLMNNKALYFTLLRNFSGRAQVDELMTHIIKNDHEQTMQKANAIKGVAANLGLNGLLAVIDDILDHAKMEVSSTQLVGELDDAVEKSLKAINQLLEGEGII